MHLCKYGLCTFFIDLQIMTILDVKYSQQANEDLSKRSKPFLETLGGQKKIVRSFRKGFMLVNWV